jgi:hypothetical protein
MAAMQLPAIFVPIVHKTSFKSEAEKKTLNKSFIVRQLLFL